MTAPMVIALPQGLNVSGVTMWAVRLANGLARRGRRITLVVHPEPIGAARLCPPIDSRVTVVLVGAQDAPPLDNCGGDISPYLSIYRRAVLELAGDGPVIFSPNLHGDCYGIAAALCLCNPELLRIVGWQHSDIEYDSRILTHYEPIISRFVPVSDAIEATLRERLARRAGDIANIPYGVACTTAEHAPPSSFKDPIRLLYAGRLEHEQKRIFALVHLVDQLAARNIAHELTIVGDGPAAPHLDEQLSTRANINRLPAAGPQQIASLLASHDAFILPSRYEGLSIAMLEAMAHGCIPILARTRSGSAQAIEPGYSGELADVAPEGDEHAAALALADAIERHIARGPQRRREMATAARATIQERFSLDLHVQRIESLLDNTASSPARSWPAQRPCAFTSAPGTGHASGSVPAEGAVRLAALLRQLAGRRIIIHGTGQHTLQLAATLAQSPAHIVAFTDDDRQRHSATLWNWPILAPAEASNTGATDVIISSWMHQDAIWSRRAIYESQGLRVHCIYDR